jgi:23S rRNA (uracil1939-C5)-methyltransferase
MRERKKNLILENIKLLTAGAKGGNRKTEEGKTVLVSGAIPGDV